GRSGWRSLGDSNPCFRRERATSWAARRREQSGEGLQIAPITAVRKQVAHGAAGPPSSPPLPTHLVRRSALTAAMKRPADAMAGTRPRRGPTDLDAPRIYRP